MTQITQNSQYPKGIDDTQKVSLYWTLSDSATKNVDSI